MHRAVYPNAGYQDLNENNKNKKNNKKNKKSMNGVGEELLPPGRICVAMLTCSSVAR